MLDLADVSAWRAHLLGIRSPDDTMSKIETAMVDVLRRDGGNGRPIHEELRIPSQQAAAFLTHAMTRIGRALRGGG